MNITPIMPSQAQQMWTPWGSVLESYSMAGRNYYFQYEATYTYQSHCHQHDKVYDNIKRHLILSGHHSLWLCPWHSWWCSWDEQPTPESVSFPLKDVYKRQLYTRLRDFLPENHCMSTANWDGYTAFWKIEDSCLYLQRMEICVYDKASRKDSTLIYHTDALKTLFASYYENGRIPARWFSGERCV